MLRVLKTVFNKIQKLIWFVIRMVVLPISLTVVYFLGIGMTYIILLIFDRKRLWNSIQIQGNTCWVVAKDYKTDYNNYMRQS
jgi:hypothetical protein